MKLVAGSHYKTHQPGNEGSAIVGHRNAQKCNCNWIHWRVLVDFEITLPMSSSGAIGEGQEGGLAGGWRVRGKGRIRSRLSDGGDGVRLAVLRDEQESKRSSQPESRDVERDIQILRGRLTNGSGSCESGFQDPATELSRNGNPKRPDYKHCLRVLVFAEDAAVLILNRYANP